MNVELHTEPRAGASHLMVGVAQLVERQVVILDVAGSSPVTHPTETSPMTSLSLSVAMERFTEPARVCTGRRVGNHGQVAQLVERRPEKASVVGSNPSLTTTSAQVAQLVERRLGGSIPSLGTKRKRPFTI